MCVKRARELAQSSGAELSTADLNRLDPENPRRIVLWWRKFDRKLRSLAAGVRRSESDPLTDDQILELMASSNVRFFKGSISGAFSNGRVVKEIRRMALEYGRRHSRIFGLAAPKLAGTRATTRRRGRREASVADNAVGAGTGSSERRPAAAEASGEQPRSATESATAAAATGDSPAPAPDAPQPARPAQRGQLDALLRGGELGEALVAAVASIQRAPPRKEATEAFVARVLCHVEIWSQRPVDAEPPPEASFTAPDLSTLTRQRKQSLGRKAAVLRRRVMRTCLQVRGHGSSPDADLSSAFGALVARLEAGLEVGAVLDALEADLDEVNELRVRKRARSNGDLPISHA